MRWGGGGGWDGGDREQEETGLSYESWKVGWILMDSGRVKRTADGLNTQSMVKGPM